MTQAEMFGIDPAEFALAARETAWRAGADLDGCRQAARAAFDSITADADDVVWGLDRADGTT